ncbi:ATP-grasp fold amidoligase family protein [Arcticibacter sp.]|uniref:ATP-grasp fold amidoligase family protein n=1 Tax=Arcticibacter sp. TaxID=1872630 RepID=UPI00388E2835
MYNPILNFLRNSGEFPARIRRRHRIFWTDPEAENVRNSKMDAGLPLEQWMEGPHWQRKLSNKYNAREFAKLNGCRVPDLYWKGRHIDDIDFASLPDQYVIRPTIGKCSKGVYVLDNGLNLFDQKRYTPEMIKHNLKQDLTNRPDLEFLFEEFVRTEDGGYAVPNDFKFLCFNGEVAAIVVIDRVSPQVGYSHFYDEHWNKLKKLHYLYPGKKEPDQPACFQEMLKQAKTLSKVYGIFVRIDFFATDKGPVFGEFTPTPAKGKNFTAEGKKLLLEYWDKYCNGLI